jgi:hypothetical protein
MTPVWRQPILDRLAAVIIAIGVMLPVAMFLLLGLALTPVFIAAAALVVVLPIVEVAILRRRMQDIWRSQRLLVTSGPEDLVGALEGALRDAGLAPGRRSVARTPWEPEREVLELAGGLNVTVITAPRGQVVYVGPDRGGTRPEVERVKAIVDGALEGLEE